MEQIIAPGTLVTCDYREGHSGIVLDIADPEAWTGSGGNQGSRGQVPSQGLAMGDRLPVRWSFGKVYVESANRLVIVPCGISWIDCEGNPTPDRNPAIGYAVLQSDKRRFPICDAHATMVRLARSHHDAKCSHVTCYPNTWHIDTLTRAS